MSDTPQFHRKPVAPQIAPKIPSVPSSYKNREHQSTVGGDGLPVFRRKPVANQVTPTIPSVPASYKARKGGLQTKDSRSPTTSPSPPPKPESPRGPALVRHKTASSISFTPSGFSEKRSASVDGLEDTEVGSALCVFLVPYALSWLRCPSPRRIQSGHRRNLERSEHPL